MAEKGKKAEMDFLTIARELEVFSIRQCGKFPKHYTFYLSVPIAESARRVMECCKRGNSIYPLNGHEAQMRRDQFLMAYAELQSMVTQVDVAREVCSIRKEIIRYGDDGIIIHRSKEYLKRCLARLRKLTRLIGLQFNWKKTHVIRLSHGWRWLKIRWWMDDDGKVVKKLNPEVVTHYRQKFKKLRALLDAGETTRDYIAQLWHCWTNMTGIKHRSGSVLPFNYNCHFTRVKMADLYHNLFAVWEGCPDVLYQTACGW